jgi:hypothetical protein
MLIVLLSATEDLQILLKGLIGSLAGSISLRVICYADILMDVQKAAEIYGKFRYKADVSV